MGSAKHMRNNGEQINIHGHDNYQMPGDYKQMGDKNQNQSLGAYKLVGDQPELDKNGNGEIDGEDFKMMQPGKISGGAAAYMRQSYGADKIGDGASEDTDPKLSSFGQAFKSAGGKNFTYKGKEYSGLTKEKAESQVSESRNNLAYERGRYTDKNITAQTRYGTYNNNYHYDSGIRRQASINSINQGLSALGKPSSGETLNPEFDRKSNQTFMMDRSSGYKGTDLKGADYVHKNDPYSTPNFYFNAPQSHNDAAFSALHRGETKKDGPDTKKIDPNFFKQLKTMKKVNK